MAAKALLRAATSACLVLGVLVTSASGAQEAPAPSPRMKDLRALIARMTNPKGLTSMMLAPGGKHIAAVGWTGEANALMLIEADTGVARVLVPPVFRPGWSALIQPHSVHWISSTSLAVDFNDGDCVVVGIDGRRGRVIGQSFLRMMPPDTPDAAPTWAIVGVQGFLHSTEIQRVNVITGESIKVPLGLPGELLNAVFDRRGRMRAARTRETKWFSPGAKITNWYRHDEAAPWQRIAEAAVTDDLWSPLGVPDDSDTLVVLSREGRDTWAMFDFDVASRRLTELPVGHPTEDLIGTAEDAGQNIIRATTHGLRPTTHWFDPRWDQLQRSIDKVMPDTVNLLRGDPNGKVLVLAYSDRDPGRWLLLDTTKMTLREIALSKPAIFPSDMRPMQSLTYPAADGMTIPAYLTLPDDEAKTPRPMVVFIHGGPVARDEWAWDLDVQVLAAAGYAVFQPQFRGSSGFGRKFEQAGYRQWGLAMQDDVTAGVKAMIDRGIADPARICIYGASYGGYAALWGLVKTPQLYQCGVSLSGVTDIGERFSDWSDTNSSKVGREWLRFAVGDIKTMASQFDAVSPQKHAAKIHVPVLLAHGKDDERVPIGHSKRMAAALTAAGGKVETHWYDDEGHGLSGVGHMRQFYGALLEFLDRSIGPASPNAVLSAPAAAASAPR
jgi:dipeptidyl aminopeptidase/acylaminoacyl peptidase